MRVFLIPAMAAAVQISSPSHHDAEQLRDTFYSLAASKEKNGGKIDDDTKVIVEQILNDIDSKLMEALWSDRDIAQQTYEGSYAGIVSANGLDLEEYRYLQSMTSRTNSEWETCTENHGQACADGNGQCGRLDTYIENWPVCNDRNLDVRGCGGCEPDPMTTDLYTTLQCLMTFDDNHYNHFTTEYETCSEHKRSLNQANNDCESKQRKFEEAKCDEQREIHEVCSAHDDAYNNAVSAHNDELANLRELENVFQKQYTALQCLKCYGNQILQESTDLTVCENGPMPEFQCNEDDHRARDTEPKVSLALCVGDAPPKVDCRAEFDDCVPGTSCFQGAHYTPWDATFSLDWVCYSIEEVCDKVECLHTCPEYGPSGP